MVFVSNNIFHFIFFFSIEEDLLSSQAFLPRNWKNLNLSSKELPNPHSFSKLYRLCRAHGRLSDALRMSKAVHKGLQQALRPARLPEECKKQRSKKRAKMPQKAKSMTSTGLEPATFRCTEH